MKKRKGWWACAKRPKANRLPAPAGISHTILRRRAAALRLSTSASRVARARSVPANLGAALLLELERPDRTGPARAGVATGPPTHTSRSARREAHLTQPPSWKSWCDTTVTPLELCTQSGSRLGSMCCTPSGRRPSGASLRRGGTRPCSTPAEGGRAALPGHAWRRIE